MMDIVRYICDSKDGSADDFCYCILWSTHCYHLTDVIPISTVKIYLKQK